MPHAKFNNRLLFKNVIFHEEAHICLNLLKLIVDLANLSLRVQVFSCVIVYIALKLGRHECDMINLTPQLEGDMKSLQNTVK